MDFEYSQEQQQFTDSIRRWAESNYDFESRKQIIYSDTGVSNKAWAAMAELGMTALPIPEEQGGFAGSAVDMMGVMQEIGRSLCVEPYFATMFGAEFLAASRSHADVLGQVATGEIKLACALNEKQSRYELNNITTSVTANASGFVVNGNKTMVLHGAQAQLLIVSARSNAASRATDGISLLLVDPSLAGVTIKNYRTLDGLRAADIEFKNVQLSPGSIIGEVGTAWELLDAVSDYGVTLLCAEAVGCMEALIATTLEYLKTRQQFGTPIGKFQVLQHRMADMLIELEQAKSLTTLAASKAHASDVQERRKAVSAAKVKVGQAGKFIGQQAVQLHGGMGVTNELAAAHYFKRLTTIDLTLGDVDHHLARFIALPDFAKAA